MSVKTAIAAIEYQIQTPSSVISIGSKNMFKLLLQCLLLARILYSAIGLPTQGYIDRHRLETYESSSGEVNDTRFFDDLTFRFTCEGKPIGLYADPNFDCRIFHACDDSGKGFPVICPNGTLFDQRGRVCTDEEIDCEHANEWFYLNELPLSVEMEDATEAGAEQREVPAVLPLNN